VEYDDGLIACTQDRVVIRRYGPLLGAKRVRYRDIRAVREVELRGLSFGMWRLWGSTDLRHWFNLDWERLHKHVGLVLDLGRRARPVITPDDPRGVARILRSHGVQVITAPRESREPSARRLSPPRSRPSG
jgi:hypothetical protein